MGYPGFIVAVSRRIFKHVELFFRASPKCAIYSLYYEYFVILYLSISSHTIDFNSVSYSRREVEIDDGLV